MGPTRHPTNLRISPSSQHKTCRLKREEHLLYLRFHLVRPESAGNHRKPAGKVKIHHHHSTPRVELQDHRKTTQDPKELLSRPFPSCVAVAGGGKPDRVLTRASELRVSDLGLKWRKSPPQGSSDGGGEENPTGAVVWVGRRWPEKPGRVTGSGSGRLGNLASLGVGEREERGRKSGSENYQDPNCKFPI